MCAATPLCVQHFLLSLGKGVDSTARLSQHASRISPQRKVPLVEYFIHNFSVHMTIFLDWYRLVEGMYVVRTLPDALNILPLRFKNVCDVLNLF
jgi:hypothetical protein